MAGNQAIYDLLCKLCGNDKELLAKLCDVYDIVSVLPTEIPPCPECPPTPKCASSTVCYNVQEKAEISFGTGDCDPADLEIGDTLCTNGFFSDNGAGGTFTIPPTSGGYSWDGSNFCWTWGGNQSPNSYDYPFTYTDKNGKVYNLTVPTCSGGNEDLSILIDDITEYKCMICEDGDGPVFFDIESGKQLEEAPQGELTSCINQINIPPCPAAEPVIFPDQVQLEIVEGCVNGVQAFREDTITNGVRVEGEVTTESTITGDFIPFPCVSKPCCCDDNEIDYIDCCCYEQSIDPAITGGWSNQLAPCDKCLDDDISIKWTQCVDETETARSYSMVGLSDTCSDSASFQEIDFAFYSILRYDVATPYCIVYIYESGTQRSWYHYERQFKKSCIDFEIRRNGSNIEYYINGNLVRSTPDTTGGACLYYDSSEHGTLNNFVTNTRSVSLCQIG